jgi:hypothetical protein
MAPGNLINGCTKWSVTEVNNSYRRGILNPSHHCAKFSRDHPVRFPTSEISLFASPFVYITKVPSGVESYELMTQPRISIQGDYATANRIALRTTLLTFTSKDRLYPYKAGRWSNILNYKQWFTLYSLVVSFCTERNNSRSSKIADPGGRAV